MAVQIMRRWIIRLAAAMTVFIILLGALLWPTDIVVVIVHRDQFEGGQLALTNGSSADVEPGSGTAIVLLKVKSDTDLVLVCKKDGELHSQRDGYIGTGPTQYMVVDVDRCHLNPVGVPRDILSVL